MKNSKRLSILDLKELKSLWNSTDNDVVINSNGYSKCKLDKYLSGRVELDV